MSNISSGSSRGRNFRGIPRKCWCGERTVILVSTTEQNPNRKFYRCRAATDGTRGHVFKWVNEAKMEEFDVLSEKQETVIEDIGKIIDCEHNMMQKLEKLMEKTKKLQCEVKTLKSTIKKTVMCVAIVGCLGFLYKLI